MYGTKAVQSMSNHLPRVVQGPTWGYPTEGAYYRDASSADSVFAVRIPLLAINAEDDPVRKSVYRNIAFYADAHSR